MADLQSETSQLVVVHLSDVHFGENHRFTTPPTAGGDTPSDRSFPTLLAKLAEDLDKPDPGCPVIVCISGDLVQTGAFVEFKQAEQFITSLATTPLFGQPRGIESIFVVPGNHDVDYYSSD